jgi:type VI secretion system FHA domain protein
VQGPGLASVLIAASSVSAEAGASTLDGLIGDGGALDVLALLGHPAGPEPSASPRGPAGLGAELMQPESRHRVLAASSFGSGAADAVANTRPEPAQPQPQPQPQPLPQRGAAAVLEQSGAAVDRARQLAAGSDATDDGANAAVRLQRAFARGCGVPAERISDFDEQAVEDIGQLMAALVSGALQMVHARSSTKHEMRANVTIIASSGNNPLKFAPDATAALMQLLGRGLPGFMAPQEAVIDAFEDLCAHQVGLLSASRSAMYAVAARLSPDRLQEAAGGPRGFSGLLPSAHKARLWDCYLKSHADLLGEAREEFDAVFQSAFVRAYEGEVQRLQAGASS